MWSVRGHVEFIIIKSSSGICSMCHVASWCLPRMFQPTLALSLDCKQTFELYSWIMLDYFVVGSEMGRSSCVERKIINSKCTANQRSLMLRNQRLQGGQLLPLSTHALQLSCPRPLPFVPILSPLYTYLLLLATCHNLRHRAVVFIWFARFCRYFLTVRTSVNGCYVTYCIVRIAFIMLSLTRAAIWSQRELVRDDQLVMPH